MFKNALKKFPLVIGLAGGYLVLGGNDGCSEPAQPPVSSSGVRQMTVSVDTNAQGHTTEQENIAARYKMDNTPGSVKWLYLISPMTGDVLLASSVKGKVTSSGKRLSPKTVSAGGTTERAWGEVVSISGRERITGEVIQDDGTYGDSGEYLYWWDQRGQYHQQFLSGALIHISDKPMHWPKVILNLESVEVSK